MRVLVLALLLLQSLPLPAAERVALVIGNASYQKMATLTGPLNDAPDIAKRLGALGFRVLEPGLNLSEEEMLERIEGFAVQARGAEVALLYYSGHGMQLDGDNYLLPVDIDPGSGARVRSDGTKLDFVLDTLKSSGARSTIVVLDACRNTPIPAVFRDGNRGFVPVDSPQGFLIAYATAAGAVAQDLGSNGRNSPYAKAFLEELAQGADAELEVFLRRVGTRVYESTHKAQFPATYNSLTAPVVLSGQAAVRRPDPEATGKVDELSSVPTNPVRVEPQPTANSVCPELSSLATDARRGVPDSAIRTSAQSFLRVEPLAIEHSSRSNENLYLYFLSSQSGILSAALLKCMPQLGLESGLFDGGGSGCDPVSRVRISLDPAERRKVNGRYASTVLMSLHWKSDPEYCADL